MPRQKNVRPTAIYWLVDIRPETITAGWLQGLPFYCGKTVQSLRKRLGEHRYGASKRPHGNVGARFLECNGHIHITPLEIVAPEKDWCARERHWIDFSRRLFPDIMTNVSDGGDGIPGYIPTAKARANMRAAQSNRSLETRAKMSAWQLGRKLSPEHCAKLSTAAKKRPPTKEQLPGKTVSPETRAKLSIANQGKKLSLETREKISAALKGREFSPEHRANLKEAAKHYSPERGAKISKARMGKKHSPATCAKISATKHRQAQYPPVKCRYLRHHT